MFDSEFLLGLVLIDIFLSDLKETHHVLGRVLHKDVLACLFFVLVNDIDKELQNGPALSHIEINLVSVAAGVGTISAENYVMVWVFKVLSGNESELNVLNSSQDRLNNPTRHLARVVLNFLGQALSHHLIEVCLPVGFVKLILKERISVLVNYLFSFLAILVLSYGL